MRFHAKSRLSLLSILAFVLPTTVAVTATTLVSSAAIASCGSFTRYGPHDGREAHFVDVGEDGPTVGDMVIGQRYLIDENGNPDGTFQWIATINKLDDNGVPLSSSASVTMTLKSGALFGVGTVSQGTELKSYSEEQGSNTKIWDVIGGTGDYSGAKGVLTLEVEDEHNIFVADITCD